MKVDMKYGFYERRSIFSNIAERVLSVALAMFLYLKADIP